VSGVAHRRRWLLVGLILLAVVAPAGCGGGGTKTQAEAPGQGVPDSRLAQKIGLESNGAGEYRLGGCTAKAVLGSPGAIQQAKEAGKRVVTDPTGHYGIEIETTHCAQVMEEAVAILNVP